MLKSTDNDERAKLLYYSRQAVLLRFGSLQGICLRQMSSSFWQNQNCTLYRNLEEGDLSIEVANHSQRIFTFIQDNSFSIFQCVLPELLF